MASRLPWNAKRCPRDAGALLWQGMYGMRVYTVVAGMKAYGCRCETCGHRYEIRRKDND